MNAINNSFSMGLFNGLEEVFEQGEIHQLHLKVNYRQDFKNSSQKFQS